MVHKIRLHRLVGLEGVQSSELLGIINVALLVKLKFMRGIRAIWLGKNAKRTFRWEPGEPVFSPRGLPDDVEVVPRSIFIRKFSKPQEQDEGGVTEASWLPHQSASSPKGAQTPHSNIYTLSVDIWFHLKLQVGNFAPR